MKLIHSTLMHVRWKDLDAFNHVNNSKYLSYLEESRLEWMLATPGLSLNDPVYPVMVASQLNYRRPIHWPNDIRINLYAEKVGNTSVTIAHTMTDPNDDSILYCDGNITAVWVDGETHKPVALPDAVRKSGIEQEAAGSQPARAVAQIAA